jgi:hypothetical protein
VYNKAMLGNKNLEGSETTIDSGITWSLFSKLLLCPGGTRSLGNLCIGPKALLFSSDSSPVISEAISLGNEFTIELWVYAFDVTSEEQIFLEYDGLLFLSVALPSAGIHTYGATAHEESLQISDIAEGNWRLVSIGTSRIVQTLMLAVDGQSVAQRDPVYVEQTMQQQLCLGGDCDANCFTGYLKEVRVWNTFRSRGNLVRNMYHKLEFEFDDQLIAYWRIDEGYGDILFDYANNVGNIQLPQDDPPIWAQKEDFQLCEEEEEYDDVEQTCKSPFKLFQIYGSVELSFPISVPMIEEITVEFLIYIESFGYTLRMQLENRLIIESDETDNSLIFQLRGAGANSIIASIPSLPTEKWLAIHVSFSAIQQKVQLYIYNLDDSEIFDNISTDFTHDFEGADSPESFILTKAEFTAYLQELRIFNEFREEDPELSSQLR